jgi:hypothetical protein
MGLDINIGTKHDSYCNKNYIFLHEDLDCNQMYTLLEILSFTTNHYAISMQLVVICNYFGHVCNYNFGIVYFLGHTIVCATNMQLNVYNMDTCYKSNGLNLYIFKLLYLIYVHMLYIIILCTSSTKVNPILT